MSLLHPAALLLLILLVPLAVVDWRRVRRERRAARAVRLEPQPLARSLQRGICAGLVIALAALAASEPSLRKAQTVELRANAEVYLFIDSSGSMLAGASPSAPTRLDQARQAAAKFARTLPEDLPLGAGAFAETPLPLTAPDGDRQTFLAALDQLTVPGKLPEQIYFGRTATNFGNLVVLTKARYFLPTTPRRRVVVMLTDAEGPAFDVAPIAASLKQAHIHLVFVRFGSPQNRLWLHPPDQSPVLDTHFTSDVSDLGNIRLLAKETGGAFYDQSRIGAAIADVNRLSGHGPDRPAETLSLYADALGQYAVLAALPLLAWLAGGLLPFSAPLERRVRSRRRRAPQPASEALSNQA